MTGCGALNKQCRNRVVIFFLLWHYCPEDMLRKYCNKSLHFSFGGCSIGGMVSTECYIIDSTNALHYQIFHFQLGTHIKLYRRWVDRVAKLESYIYHLRC